MCRGGSHLSSRNHASRAQAIPLFDAGCKAKQAWGCLGMADAYIHGWGVTRNLKTAGDYELQRGGVANSERSTASAMACNGALCTVSRNARKPNRSCTESRGNSNGAMRSARAVAATTTSFHP